MTEPSTVLREALMEHAAAGRSGVLRVTGAPGGTIHLARGRVCAVETPGAPSPEVLLLRSHRITESSWDAAFTAAAAVGGRMSAELTARDLIGGGELEALLRVAFADAMFALVSGPVTECGEEKRGPGYLLPLEPGAGAGWLLAEAERRMRVLASLAFPPGPERVTAAPGAVNPEVRLGEGRDEILALADGRRTPRDMAFALGRGVYATTLQVARMREAGLLVAVPQRTERPASQDAGQDAPPELAAGLPHRGKDRPALPRRAGHQGRAPAPLGLLRPRAGQSEMS